MMQGYDLELVKQISSKYSCSRMWRRRKFKALKEKQLIPEPMLWQQEACLFITVQGMLFWSITPKKRN